MEETKSEIGPRNATEQVEIQQYIEYAIVYVSHVDNSQNTNTILRVCHIIKISLFIHLNYQIF